MANVIISARRLVNAKQDARSLRFVEARTEAEYQAFQHAGYYRRVIGAVVAIAICLLGTALISPKWSSDAVPAVLVFVGHAVPAGGLIGYIMMNRSPLCDKWWSLGATVMLVLGVCCSQALPTWCAPAAQVTSPAVGTACGALRNGFLPFEPMAFTLIVPHIMYPFLRIGWREVVTLAVITSVSAIVQYAAKVELGVITLVVIAALNAAAATMLTIDNEKADRKRWATMRTADPVTAPSTRHLVSAPSKPRMWTQADAAIVSELVNTSPNMMIATDSNGILRWVSAGCDKLLHKVPAELVGKPYEALVVPEDAVLLQHKIMEARDTPDVPFAVTFRRQSPDNPAVYRTMEFTGQFISRYGAPVGLVGWERDLSKGRRSNPTGATPVVKNDKIVTYATHELRNALHALDAICGMFESNDISEEQREDVVDMMLASRQIHLLVDDVLKMVDMRSGTLDSSPACAAFRGLLQDSVAVCQAVAKPGVKISSEIDTNIPRKIVIDQDLLSQIVQNILLNEARHASTDSVVTIRCTRVGDTKLRIVISDDGHGVGSVDVKSLRHALEAGRLPNSSRCQRIALFLPICSGLAEAMAGTLTVDQKRDRLAFILELPYTLPSFEEEKAVADDDTDVGFVPFTSEIRPAGIAESKGSEAGAGAGAGEDEAKGGAAPPKKKRARRSKGKKDPKGLPGYGLLNMFVLLVDDISMIRRLGAKYLDMLGCTYQTLEDGDQVEEALHNAPRPFDAILMDIVMHRTDGAEICKALRDIHGARLPIIAMTAHTEATDRKRFEAMGFDLVLAKPFNMESLGQALIAGKRKRGNTRFTRMSARLDEDRHHHTPAAMPGTALPSIPDGGEDSDGDEIADMFVDTGDLSDDEMMVMQPSHVNKARAKAGEIEDDYV